MIWRPCERYAPLSAEREDFDRPYEPCPFVCSRCGARAEIGVDAPRGFTLTTQAPHERKRMAIKTDPARQAGPAANAQLLGALIEVLGLSTKTAACRQSCSARSICSEKRRPTTAPCRDSPLWSGCGFLLKPRAPPARFMSLCRNDAVVADVRISDELQRARTGSRRDLNPCSSVPSKSGSSVNVRAAIRLKLNS